MHDSNHRPSLLSIKPLLVFALAVLSGTYAAQAQANSTASKSADISVFGGFSHGNPDYGPQDNNGITIGADYTRYFGWRVDPSLEIRANRTNGDLITQKSAQVGIRLQSDFRRFHPYVDGLIGGTSIHFKIPPNPYAPKYVDDSAFSYSIGGGVDIDVIRNFQAKVDYQREFMNFGPNGTQPGNGDFTLSPSLWTIGVVYRIPFRPRPLR
jgi:opacity protein-like surface antigen